MKTQVLVCLGGFAIYKCLGSCTLDDIRQLALRGGETEAFRCNDTIEKQMTWNQTWNATAIVFNDTTISSADKVTRKRRRKFLHRMRYVSNSLLLKERDAALCSSPEDGPDDTTTPQSDLMRPGRHFTVVTTAALPWMTGTAVNPLLRAAHLVRLAQQVNAQDSKQWVTLIVPWLELPADRSIVYPNHDFQSPQEQEAYIRSWLSDEAGMQDVASPENGLRIVFYPARYHKELFSIFALGDITALTAPQPYDVCILEEPEHLNWFRAPGQGWAKKFQYVIGVVHTNYRDYASTQIHGLWSAPALSFVSAAMVRAYCHSVIKLSDVLQTFCTEKEVTSNVHGVRNNFIEQGLEAQASSGRGGKKAYFIGKVIWQKGFDTMLDLQDYYKQVTGSYFEIDIYGTGNDEKEIARAFHGRNKRRKEQQANENDVTKVVKNTADSSNNKVFDLVHMNSALVKLEKIKQTIRDTTESLEDFSDFLPKTLHEWRRKPIPATFMGRIDHASIDASYQIFINPSVTEVLCTTTAEALAMGKFAIIPDHPSNAFFLRFPNALAYRNRFEFVANLRWAQTHDPEPLTPQLAREFSWEAATERLVQASSISFKEARERERLGLSKLDERIAWFHNEVFGKGERGDALRKVLGAGPVSDQVKYQKQSQMVMSLDDEEMSDYSDTDDSDDEGFLGKFFGSTSAIAGSLRETLSNGLPALIPDR